MLQRAINLAFGCVIACVLLLPTLNNPVRADSPLFSNTESWFDRLSKNAEEGTRVKLTGSHLYWKDGLHWDSEKKNLTLKVGGKFAVDTGNIDADEELDTGFPNLGGYNSDIRVASLYGYGWLYKFLEYKLEVDFANIREIQDNWVRFRKMPYLGYLQMGHMKEPFSLEREASNVHKTFMENSLPTQALATGRNLGMMLFNTVLDDRITWKVGGFFNTGSFSDVGNPEDRISDAKGYNIPGRVTGRPCSSKDGKRLLHLGLSYSYRSRDADLNDPDRQIRFSTRPESRLTDDRLADTGLFFSDGINTINSEFAMVSGPFSLQGEYFHSFVDFETDLQFFGFYLYGTYAITGEHRRYNPLRSIFTGIRPDNDFRPFEGKWGAWEVAARLSYLDLNDGPIRGGEELNFTAGLNWYLRPNLRLMVNYVRADLRDRREPREDDGVADIIMSRIHLFF
jgi:phosphate-selective porin OprO/OprP